MRGPTLSLAYISYPGVECIWRFPCILKLIYLVFRSCFGMTAACKSSWPRAQQLLEQMQRKAIEPNDTTYSAAISACELSCDLQCSCASVDEAHSFARLLCYLS